MGVGEVGGEEGGTCADGSCLRECRQSSNRQTQVQMQRGNDDDSGAGSVVVVVVADRLFIRQKQESCALSPSVLE
jgi:hypothetical protein